MGTHADSKQYLLDFANRRKPLVIQCRYAPGNDVTLHHGDCRELLAAMPQAVADLVVTSPPYNLGKEYERRLDIQAYIREQSEIIAECARVMSDRGSICWQVGNYVDQGAIVPLDTLLYPTFAKLGLRMRNRIIWHFEHGLHCRRRFSGRYETIVWFTKSDQYLFDLDAVRIPQKYPGKKYYKGPKAGKYSCNPLGKNPGDLWSIPNVKSNHVEKTNHPCQFPVELVERLVLSMTEPGSLVLDPFMGAGTTAVAAVRHGRKVAGAELMQRYHDIAMKRVNLEAQGALRTRPMNKPIHSPSGNEQVVQNPFQQQAAEA
jgi:adenine-specific DNA-methyltransferase